jgi:hypothetical protein
MGKRTGWRRVGQRVFGITLGYEDLDVISATKANRRFRRHQTRARLPSDRRPSN